MQAELNSLMRREVFSPIVQTLKGVKLVGYKCVVVRKHNENNEIITHFEFILIWLYQCFILICYYLC